MEHWKGRVYVPVYKRIHYNSPVMLTFTLLALAAFLLDRATGGATNTLLFSVYRAPLSDPLMYLRVFTHILGHTTTQHYFSNFMIILLIGPILEEKYGSLRILKMLLITAAVTGILYMAFFPGVALLGASGEAFMLIVLASFVNIEKGKFPLTFVMIVALYLGVAVLPSSGGASGDVAVLAHVLGGVCGVVFGVLINRGKQTVPST
jgi:membrane associated rhomboid family serine protease